MAGLLVSPGSASSTEDLTVALSVGKGTFVSGEPVPLEITVRYEGKQDFILSFGSAQRYDFQIESPGGEILWRWSEGRVFAQTMGQVILRPDQPEIRFRATFQGTLSNGRYTVRGMLTTLPRPVLAVAEIAIQ